MSHTEEPFYFPLQRNQSMLCDNSLGSVMFLFHSQMLPSNLQALQQLQSSV